MIYKLKYFICQIYNLWWSLEEEEFKKIYKSVQIADQNSHQKMNTGYALAQWVNCWPTDLGVGSSSPAQGEIFST